MSVDLIQQTNEQPYNQYYEEENSYGFCSFGCTTSPSGEIYGAAKITSLSPSKIYIDCAVSHPSIIRDQPGSIMLALARSGDLSEGSNNLAGVHTLIGPVQLETDGIGRSRGEIQLKFDDIIGRALCVLHTTKGSVDTRSAILAGVVARSGGGWSDDDPLVACSCSLASRWSNA